jgi:hypothetical protein
MRRREFICFFASVAATWPLAARALAGNRLVYRSGVPVAVLAASEVTFFLELDPASK